MAVNRPIQLAFTGSRSEGTGMAINMSATGLAVTAALAPEVGEIVRCQLPFVPREPISLQARVVWVHPPTEPSREAAIGLCFDEITQPASARVSRLVKRMSVARRAGVAFDPLVDSGTWAPNELLGEHTAWEKGRQRWQLVALAGALLLLALAIFVLSLSL